MSTLAERLIKNLNVNEVAELVEAIKKAIPSMVSQSFFTRLQVDEAYARGFNSGKELVLKEVTRAVAGSTSAESATTLVVGAAASCFEPRGASREFYDLGVKLYEEFKERLS